MKPADDESANLNPTEKFRAMFFSGGEIILFLSVCERLQQIEVFTEKFGFLFQFVSDKKKLQVNAPLHNHRGPSAFRLIVLILN